MEDFERKDLIFIQTDTKGVKNRIADCMAVKRREVDRMNVLEFCNRILSNEDDRDPSIEEDSYYVRNAYGPQTQMQPEAKRIKQEPSEMEHLLNDASLQAIDERLQNMELQLKLKLDSKQRCKIYKRMKDLEDRILLLESLSPEYFNLPILDDSSPKKESNFDKERMYRNCNSDELRRRIESLKESLKAKSLNETQPNV